MTVSVNKNKGSVVQTVSSLVDCRDILSTDIEGYDKRQDIVGIDGDSLRQLEQRCGDHLKNDAHPGLPDIDEFRTFLDSYPFFNAQGVLFREDTEKVSIFITTLETDDSHPLPEYRTNERLQLNKTFMQTFYRADVLLVAEDELYVDFLL